MIKDGEGVVLMSVALNDRNKICVGGIQVSKDNFTTCLQSIGQPTPVENMKTFVFNTVA